MEVTYFDQYVYNTKPDICTIIDCSLVINAIRTKLIRNLMVSYVI